MKEIIIRKVKNKLSNDMKGMGNDMIPEIAFM
jgi:hypothetical protein